MKFLLFCFIGNYYHYETTCSPSCTKNYPESRVVFSSYLHMHKVGRQIWYSLTRFDESGSIYERSILVLKSCFISFFQLSEFNFISLHPRTIESTGILRIKRPFRQTLSLIQETN